MSVNDINPGNVIQDVGLVKTQVGRERNTQLQTEFLDLMMAQLNTQVPLKTMQQGDFLTQMAQLGSENEVNKARETLANSLQSNQALQASTLVGRSVLAPSSHVVLNQTSMIIGVLDLKQSTPAMTLSIMNYKGELVKTLLMGANDAGQVPFSWDGTNNDGVKMPKGNYTLVAYAQGQDSRFSVGTFVKTSVESVTIGNGGQPLTLNLRDLGQVSLSQVREIN